MSTDASSPSNMAKLQPLIKRIQGLQHIGHIVRDLRESIASFQRLYGVDDGCVQVFPDFDQPADSRFAFIQVGELEFELIEPVSDALKEQLFASPCAGGGLNHVAYKVDDVQAALEDLAPLGIKPGYVTPAGPVDTGRRWMVYLDPATTDGLLVELIADKPVIGA